MRSAPRYNLSAGDTALYFTMGSENDGSTLHNDLDLLPTWETRWDMDAILIDCHNILFYGEITTFSLKYKPHISPFFTIC